MYTTIRTSDVHKCDRRDFFRCNENLKFQQNKLVKSTLNFLLHSTMQIKFILCSYMLYRLVQLLTTFCDLQSHHGYYKFL